MEPLLTDDKLASVLGVDEKTLERWRREGGGPKYIRVGRLIRYRPEDVRAWLETRASA